MRVLFDESVPRAFARHFVGHEVRTVTEMGWSSRSNGDLLTLASEQFEFFLTVDQNIEYQQNLDRFDIALVTLLARTNRLQDLLSLAPDIQAVLEDISTGQAVRIGV